MAGFNHFGKIGNAIEARGAQLVSAYAAHWQSAASQLAPVDTGDLAGSVTSTLEGPHQARIAATMDYAVHVEFGTMDSPAQPFMRPSRDALNPTFKKDLKAMLKP